MLENSSLAFLEIQKLPTFVSAFSIPSFLYFSLLFPLPLLSMLKREEEEEKQQLAPLPLKRQPNPLSLTHTTPSQDATVKRKQHPPKMYKPNSDNDLALFKYRSVIRHRYICFVLNAMLIASTRVNFFFCRNKSILLHSIFNLAECYYCRSVVPINCFITKVGSSNLYH